MPKNWWFQTAVLEKTLESPLNCKEIKPVNPKGNQSWTFIERTDAEVEAPVLWPPDVKGQLIEKDPDAGKDWGQEEKGMTEDEMVGWHHRLNGHESEETLGDSEGQGTLARCSPWGCKELDTIEKELYLRDTPKVRWSQGRTKSYLAHVAPTWKLRTWLSCGKMRIFCSFLLFTCTLLLSPGVDWSSLRAACWEASACQQFCSHPFTQSLWTPRRQWWLYFYKWAIMKYREVKNPGNLETLTPEPVPDPVCAERKQIW